jgi:hypothetical protein
MDRIYICLSKTGDLCNFLPVALAASNRSEKVGVMASAEYAPILDGISYAEKIVFYGKPWAIKEAVEEAKKLCPNVTVCMTNGPKDAIEEFSYKPAGQSRAVTDSFCRESWKLAGCLKEWGKIPLVFDRRDKEREKLLIPKGKKRVILVSAGSASSPFPYRELLMELVRLKYGKSFNVIDLSEIKAERFYDLLGLYEIAHCLITVDTSHLHLAYAVPTLPVMALIQDKPIYWYGSAWRPSHKFHCRYRDFPSRALELFTAIDNLMNPPDPKLPMVVTYGKINENKTWYQEFVVQYGTCRRDAVNVLDDKEHLPMLQDVIRMAMQVVQSKVICLTRQDVVFTDALKSTESGTPCYAWRMNRDKSGNDTFFPAVDMVAAPVEFWVKIFGELPDIVMGADSYWGLLLMQIFKKHGAIEIGGVYRHE